LIGAQAKSVGWLGARVIVLGGVRIGEGAIILKREGKFL
jgi:acetyltransferase-like isoleucine patch superfamily enzyme